MPRIGWAARNGGDAGDARLSIRRTLALVGGPVAGPDLKVMEAAPDVEDARRDADRAAGSAATARRALLLSYRLWSLLRGRLKPPRSLFRDWLSLQGAVLATEGRAYGSRISSVELQIRRI